MKNQQNWMKKMKKRTIKEIKDHLQSIESKEDPFLQELGSDERKGVQTALKQWVKKYEAKERLIEQAMQMSRYENKAREAGFNYIAGIDEVGRGPLAGPVVAAAVILNPEQPIIGLDDSKKLSELKRKQLFKEIKEKAIAVAVGSAEAAEIDQINILQATKSAMHRAVQQLDVEPDLLLVDAETLDLPIEQRAIIKGDSNSNSIAAASIVAKVIRDDLMNTFDQSYPEYGFKNNVGYGTKMHLEALAQFGPTPIHRKSFAPVKKYLK